MLRGALFDFDGTIFHSEQFHFSAIRDTFKEFSGEELDEDELRAYGGLTYRDRFLHILAMRDIDDDELLTRLTKQGRARLKQIENMKEALVPGVEKFIHELHQRDIALGIVSSADSSVIQQYLNDTSLGSSFTIIIGRDSVRTRKPHPEPYLHAMQELNLLPENTIAFEDSPPGVESAYLAGIPVVGLLTTYHASDLGKAKKTIRDYTEITIRDIEELL